MSLNLNNNGLICLTGKNGIGKTTLVKCLRNIQQSDTFQKTTSPSSFQQDSELHLSFDRKKFFFSYNEKLGSMDTKVPIDQDLADLFDIELPIPYGRRFNFHQSISDADQEIRKAIALSTYQKPIELIKFLNTIYNTKKFNHLKQVNFKKEPHYFIKERTGKYIREDYFSSGEFFLISLFRKINQNRKIIVIDEIEISLDTTAQVKLIEQLREYSKDRAIIIIFTTHSLAIMKTLNRNELFYLRRTRTAKLQIENLSFNHINSLLFGFTGWDKYILTEDSLLSDFIEYTINSNKKTSNVKHKVIYIGGATNTTDLAKRNKKENFLTTENNVLCVLDGDQRNLNHSKTTRVCFLPWHNLESLLLDDQYLISKINIHYINKKSHDGSHIKKPDSKRFYNDAIKNIFLNQIALFNYVQNTYNSEFENFSKEITEFLMTP